MRRPRFSAASRCGRPPPNRHHRRAPVHGTRACVAQAHAEQGRDVAEERGLLRHRSNSTGPTTPDARVPLGDDGGRDRIPRQRRQLAEALRRHQHDLATAAGELDANRAVDQPEQLGRRDAGAQDDLARFVAARLQVAFDPGERRGGDVGEERMQGQRRNHRVAPGAAVSGACVNAMSQRYSQSEC